MSLEAGWDRRFCRWLAARSGSESIIEAMVIDMNEAQVRTVEQVRQVLEVLARRGAELWIDGCRLVDLAREHGTPLYVYSRAAMRADGNGAWALLRIVYTPSGIPFRE